jgi:anti-sigma factor RsiW
MLNWIHRCCHPSPAKLLLYADNNLPPAKAQRVHDHVSRCQRCWDELNLIDETVQWLAVSLRSSSGEPLAGIRARLVSELRKPAHAPGLGACTRLCLGPRSFAELARRLRRMKCAAEPRAITAPLLAAFVGRKTLPLPTALH